MAKTSTIEHDPELKREEIEEVQKSKLLTARNSPKGPDPDAFNPDAFRVVGEGVYARSIKK